jgi:hypothetical protein
MHHTYIHDNVHLMCVCSQSQRPSSWVWAAVALHEDHVAAARLGRHPQPRERAVLARRLHHRAALRVQHEVGIPAARPRPEEEDAPAVAEQQPARPTFVVIAHTPFTRDAACELLAL